MKRSASTECFDNGGTAVLVPPYNTVKYEITTPREIRLVMAESKIYPPPSLRDTIPCGGYALIFSSMMTPFYEFGF
ncbi:MAG: hypothetical protein ABSD50_09765 [Smithella sp.]